MEKYRSAKLSRRNLPWRGTPVFGFDVQEGLFGRVVGDGGGERETDALFDGGLRHRAYHRHRDALIHRPELHCIGQAHTACLLRVPVQRPIRNESFLRLTDGRRSEALAASFVRYSCWRLSVFQSGCNAICPAFGLVEAVGATERFFVVLLQCKTHTAGLFGSIDEVRGREGFAKLRGRSGGTRRGGSSRGRSVRSA